MIDDPTLHLHAPQASEFRLTTLLCPTCKQDREMAAWFTEWYGWDKTCLTCGERWHDGEQDERPFAPKWREKSVARARKRMAREVQP